MLHSVSVPSPVAGVTTAGVVAVAGVTTAGVLLLSVTDNEPFAFLTMVYCANGPLYTDVSQFTGAAEPQSAGAVTLLTISRTLTRLPGSTRPANTACCNVIPAVPGPKLPLVAVFSIMSVRPSSVPPTTTAMDVRSSRSPSMISSPERPVKLSLPGPPSRMSPSPQTGPVSGHAPAADRDVVWAAVPSHAVTGGSSAASPRIRATPAWSRASQPVKPAPPTSRGLARTPSVPLMTSLNDVPESASVSCHRSR